ncbi:MAG: methyltransferase domain-containing protein [Caldilineaceae bacterium]|nr:methyltransferase domain-containing protein [Caldilineaceae bacterium]HRJ44161.1 class I SAM-dependent methyltransferase [Caldilineaceae bacterium]
MKLFYEITYRYFRAPWDLGPRRELVEAVESSRIQPCKTIDLGCGTASNAIFLAQHGFDVTGTDYSPAAIALCRERGAAAGVSVQWLEDDLTNLQHVKGTFDLLVDWGVYDDLSQTDRQAYLRNVLPLTHAQSQFLIYVHQWPPRWWEKRLPRLFGTISLRPGEIQADFGPYFEIETLTERRLSGYIAGEAVYLMTRKGGSP